MVNQKGFTLVIAHAAITCGMAIGACGTSSKPKENVSRTRIEQGVKLAECMRVDGLGTFSDPTTSPPSTPPAPNATILGGPDGVFSLTASMVQSPVFKQASPMCGFSAFGHGFKTPVALPAR